MKLTCCHSRKSSASGKFDVRVEKAVTCGGTKRGTDVATKPQPTPLQQPLHVSQLLQPCDVLIKLSNVQAAIKRSRSERLFGTRVVQGERLLSEEKGNWWWKLLKSYFNVSQSVCYSFSVTPSPSRWLFVFFCLSSACEVKVASMVTAHSVYATTSHFITSCWWLWFACVPVCVCV